MKYVTAEVSNYKSFPGTKRNPLTFDPGLNILIGRNNVGKTALLEALSLRFGNNPHRSLASAPRATAALPPTSAVDVTFSATGAEVAELLDARTKRIKLPLMADSTRQPVNYADECLNSVLTQTVTVRARFEGGDLRNVGEFSGPYAPVSIDSPCLVFEREPLGRRWNYKGRANSDGERLEYVLAHAFQRKVYGFHAERMHIGVHAFGAAQELSPDARNLPEVLNSLQTQNPPRYWRYNEFVGRVLPSVRWVGVRPTDDRLEVVIWEHELHTERQDLAVSLLESGTGISQVLAMLYVIATAETDRVVIIDEPNSFLHPGAVRALLEIFREHPRHQYIISTHSPQTIAGVGGDARIHLLQKDLDLGTTHIQVNPAETAQVREVLAQVGARISDVFGAESVLWVEGATEEACFRLIIEQFLRIPLRGIAVVGVRNTGDFDRETLDGRWSCTAGFLEPVR